MRNCTSRSGVSAAVTELSEELFSFQRMLLTDMGDHVVHFIRL